MYKPFILWGAAFAMTAVLLGAFGAHALKTILPEKSLNIFETGVRYQFYHAMGLVFCGIIFKEYNNKFILLSGRLLIIGVLLFSGSLYLLTSITGASISGLNWLGILTPIGGIFLIIGWLLMILGLRVIK